jgi:hypothetical protein
MLRPARVRDGNAPRLPKINALISSRSLASARRRAGHDPDGGVGSCHWVWLTATSPPHMRLARR